MPQFDVTSFSSQVFWLILSFVPLYWAMSKRFVPVIQKLMEERSHRIEGTLEKARLLDLEIQTFIQEREQILRDARNGAALILREALEKLSQETRDRQILLEGELSDRVWETETLLMNETKELNKELPELALKTTYSVIEVLTPYLKIEKVVEGVVHRLIPPHRKAA